MNAAPRNYRRGIAIVLGVVISSAALVAGTVGDRPASDGTAGEKLEAHPLPLGPFRLTEAAGREVGDAEMSGKVWVAAFIFTSCPASCPRITSQMKGLQEKLAYTGVQLVSVTVDPDRDTPEVLAKYAEGFGADRDRWWFLTGDKPVVYDFLERFKLLARETTEAERAGGAEEIAHAQKLALVDRGNDVVGYFEANDPEAIARLISRARRLDDRRARLLPSVNATLNGTCAALLILALGFIRSGKVKAHAMTMIAALVVSGLFLGCYLFYHFVVAKGSVPFQGVGRPIRGVYFTILLSHTVLAVVNLPMIILAVVRALKRQWAKHAAVASMAYPIWLYVSVTGVVVYWMLYRMDFSGVVSAV